MKFSQDLISSRYRIHAYNATSIQIHDQAAENTSQPFLNLSQPFIISAQHLIYPWYAGDVMQLKMTDLAPIKSIQPSLLLLGTGQQHRLPSVELQRELLQLGVGFEIMSTAAACRTFNVLLAEGRLIAAALFL